MRIAGVALSLLFLVHCHPRSFGTVLIRRLGGGGGTPYNLGDDTVNPNQLEINGGTMYWTANAFTTTTAGTVGDGCIYANSIPGTLNGKVAIFTNASPHSRVCISDSISIPDTGDAWHCEDMSDDGCGTLSASTAYMLAFIPSGSMHIYFNDGAGTWEVGANSGGTFASPPSSLSNFNSGDGDLNQDDPFSIYVEINP